MLKQRGWDRAAEHLFPPKNERRLFRKYEYVYDEYYDCYLCPADQVLSYSTTNRDGYKEYKSDPQNCEHCQYLSQCTLSKKHVKVVTRHVWQEDVDEADENRYRYDLKDLYKYRKETIERIFGLAKELHGFRYTQQFGKAQMEVKAALTFACMNLKKLAKNGGKPTAVHCICFDFWTSSAIFSTFTRQTLFRPMPKAGLSTG